MRVQSCYTGVSKLKFNCKKNFTHYIINSKKKFFFIYFFQFFKVHWICPSPSPYASSRLQCLYNLDNSLLTSLIMTSFVNSIIITSLQKIVSLSIRPRHTLTNKGLNDQA